MKNYARPIILVLAAAGLIASAAALYIHYESVSNPAYTSFCDVSETVTCQAVLESPYGRMFGVPVAAGGAIWSALVLLLALGMPGPKRPGLHPAPSPNRLRANALRRSAVASAEAEGPGLQPTTGPSAPAYIFLLSVPGLAAVLYLGYASFFVLEKACPLCLTMYAAVIGIFIVSGAASASLAALPSRLGRDLRALLASPVAATLAAIWLIGSISLVAFFPREQAAPAAAAVTAPLPTETLEGELLEQFHKWIDEQPRVSLNVPKDGARVVVVKFNDYQCPACRETYVQYKGIVAKYEAAYPGQVKFISKDFPLEAECNAGTVHQAACEAAAAVRMARARNKAEALEEWLFAHQETMTRDSVKQGLEEVAQITDFDAQYPKILEEVRADAALGRELDIKATPTFFVNGIKVQGGLRPMYFDALIAYELKRP